MSDQNESGILAVDVGNSQVKFGWFAPEPVCDSDLKPGVLPIARPKLPEPEETLAASHVGVSAAEFMAQVDDWVKQLPVSDLQCYLASVHADAEKLVQEILSRCESVKSHILTAADLPLEVRVDEPERVGIDRLLCGVAANRLRERNRPAVIVSMGTACTVNLIAPDGAFEGGAILPGIAMAADALHQDTSALPRLVPDMIDAPADAIGKSTQAAISSGLVWGAAGAVQGLIDRMTEQFENSPQVFLTGGDAQRLVGKLNSPAMHVENMVLAGIQIAVGDR